MPRLKNKDIAAALGLSTAAVSMALNNKPGVSDETRQQVLKYYQSHSDSSARPVHLTSSVHQKTLILNIHKTSGSILIDKPFFSRLMNAIEREARRNGYSLTMSHYDSSMNLEEHVQLLNSMRASGVLILATELTEESLNIYRTLQVPYILMDGSIDSLPTDAVTLDNQNAIFRAYEYAHGQGHRNIGYIKCSTPIPNFKHRFDGFMLGRLYFESDLSRDPVVFSLPGNMEKAFLEMEKTLDSLPSDFAMPSCFLCDMDFIAIGAMRAFQNKGYRLPDDVSFIGFDDIDFSTIIQPSLTTIHLHEATLGKYSVRLLLDRIEDPGLCARTVSLTGDLVIRNSVKKLI